MSTKFRGDFHSIFGEGECEYLCLLLKKVLMVLSNLDTIINNINKLVLFVSDIRILNMVFPSPSEFGCLSANVFIDRHFKNLS